MANDPEYRDKTRARLRENETLRRRAAGVQPRNSKPYKLKDDAGYKERSRADSLPADPFIEWMGQQVRSGFSIAELEKMAGLAENQLQRIYSRQVAKSVKKGVEYWYSYGEQVSAGLVDRVLMARNGSATLATLYPDEM